MSDLNKKICKKYILAPSCREVYLPLSSGILQNLRDEGIMYGGVSFLKDYYTIIRPEPRNSHLIFTLKGKGKLRVDGGEFELFPGTLYVGLHGMPQHYTLDGDYWEIAWLNVADIPNELNAMIKLSPLIRNSENGEKIKELIVAANNEYLKMDRHSFTALTSIAQLLLITLWREFAVDKADADSECVKFQTLKNKIGADVGRNWNIKSLIKESGMFYTSVHFNRLCRKHLGMPAMKKVVSMRMNEAKKLLLSTDYPIGLIGERCGYCNAYAFSTAFKKHFGASPKKMRSQNDTR
ncbi:MAG: hypothetical protein A2017_20495 [Lentisphaerae bacterium GWF2_44_16]|nr:MAG: hypothetical protein A2017_20495 [Lentisphaerae bacterium GWF2_44_16]